MARFTSPFTFSGKIGEFVATRDGVIRQAPPKRPITAPRVLENNAEFGTAGRLAKIVRGSLNGLQSDRYLTARLVKVLRAGIALDTVNDRGKRVLTKANAQVVLPGFELNDRSSLSTIVPITTDIVSDSLVITRLGGGTLNARDVNYPSGTTEVELIAYVSVLDFSPLEVVTIATSQISQPVTGGELILSPTVLADPDLITIVALGVRFYQTVNGQLYKLNNGTYDSAQILFVV